MYVRMYERINVRMYVCMYVQHVRMYVLCTHAYGILYNHVLFMNVCIHICAICTHVCIMYTRMYTALCITMYYA